MAASITYDTKGHTANCGLESRVLMKKEKSIRNVNTNTNSLYFDIMLPERVKMKDRRVSVSAIISYPILVRGYRTCCSEKFVKFPGGILNRVLLSEVVNL